MELVSYNTSFDRSLTSFYNAQIAGVPHCYPVAPDEIGVALAHPRESLQSQQILVATDAGKIRGFIHCAVQPIDEHYAQPTGIIVFLGYERGHRAVGQALLEAAEADFRQREIKSIVAFHQRYRYPFYGFNHCYLSNHLDHIEALLGFNGYGKNLGGEIFLDAVGYQPLQPIAVDFSFDIELEWKEGPGKRPDLSVHARQGGLELGICTSLSCAAIARDAALEDWHFCDGLSINDEWQGRGLGRHLLERARLEMYAVGYRHAAISTSLKNYRALQFYSNYGYRVVDYTYVWDKDL